VRVRRRRSAGHETTCRQAFGLVAEYLDGALSTADRRRFETHLAECEHCTEHLRQLELAVALTGRIREQDLDPAARDDLLALYRRWRADRPTETS